MKKKEEHFSTDLQVKTLLTVNTETESMMCF